MTLGSRHDSKLSSGRQTPRLLTPCTDDVFDDENDDDISTELTEPEATPWLFRPIAPPEDSSDYDLAEHDIFQAEEDEEDAWSAFMTGIPMEIEFLNDHGQLSAISCVSNERYCIEDEETELDRILLALRSRNDEFPVFTGQL